MPKNNKNKNNQNNLLERPPVVVVLGHIDHGKTTLLSSIKNADLNCSEHGGITQHTSAYQICAKNNSGDEKKITFIDTPGHAAFPQMRSRGAQVADIAVLVVAADDSVQQQTEEALSHIKASNIPFIVAINKTDLESSNVSKVKQDLLEYGVAVEGYGGQIVACEVSAKEVTGIENLLEMILLTAELEELNYNPDADPWGVIIESNLDQFCGPLATIVAKDGVFEKGQQVKVDDIEGKIKAMRDIFGKQLDQAHASTPFEVLGLGDVPPVGGVLYLQNTEPPQQVKLPKKVRLADFGEIVDQEKDAVLKLIIKADTQGTLEAVQASLASLNVEGADIEVGHQAVGPVTDSDIMLASGLGAIIVAFNTDISSQTEKFAKKEGVEIRSYNIIYHLLEDIEKALQGQLQEKKEAEYKGKGEVIAVFPLPSGDVVAGTRIDIGEFDVKDQVYIVRKDKVVHQGYVKKIEHEKEKLQTAEAGENYGLNIRPSFNFKIGDQVITASKGKTPA